LRFALLIQKKTSIGRIQVQQEIKEVLRLLHRR
jgi:hypothetical protein